MAETTGIEIQMTVRTWLDTYESAWTPLTADEALAMEEMQDRMGEILADPTGRLNMTLPGGARRFFAARNVESVQFRTRPAGGA